MYDYSKPDGTGKNRTEVKYHMTGTEKTDRRPVIGGKGI